MTGNQARHFAAALLAAAIGCGTTSALGQGLFGDGSKGASGKKQPIPAVEQQNEVLKLIREVFEKEYEAARTVLQKEALAKELLKRGVESKEPTEAYVLMRVARDMAAIVGEADLACKAVDEMGRRYEIDLSATKREIVAKAAKGATLTRHHKAVAQQAAALVEDAILADDYDLAREMLEMAKAAAPHARDGELLSRVTERAAEVEEVAKAKKEVEGALETLEKSPADPKANLAAGLFYCLYRGDWDRGLPMLALAADGTLDALAKREMAGPNSADAEVALGDGWWDLMDKYQGIARTQVRSRAALWYEKALPKLSGLSEMRVKKRLEEIEEAESVAVDEPRRPDEKGPRTVVRRNNPSFAGSWQDRFGNEIEFKVEGRQAVAQYKNYDRIGSHKYLNYEGRMAGKLSRDGRTLTGEWARTSVYSSRIAYSGTFVFKLSRDGRTFAGTYTQSDNPGLANTWAGWRVAQPTGGKPASGTGTKPSPTSPSTSQKRDDGFTPSFGPRPGDEGSKRRGRED